MSWWRKSKSRRDEVDRSGDSAVADGLPSDPECKTGEDGIDVKLAIEGIVARLRSLEDGMHRAFADMSAKLDQVRDERPLLQKVVSPPPVVPPLPAPDDATPDAEYLRHLLRITGHAPVSLTSGRILDIVIIGRLRDGSVGWFGAAEMSAGRMSRQLLGDLMPQEGDIMRARVVSYMWGHVVEAIVPGSLRSPLAARASTPMVEVGGERAPDSVAGTWKERLVAGSVVLARIPYDGHLPVDRQGRLAKERPSVFIRWENGYAVLRAIYDRGGWVGSRDLGTDLKDTHCLDKDSVVRDAEFDIDEGSLIRYLGHLGTRDSLTIGIPRLSGPAGAVTERRPRVSVEDVRSADADSVLATIGAAPPNGYLGLVAATITALVSLDHVGTQLSGTGLPFSYLGAVVKQVAKALGIETPRTGFADTVERCLVSVSVPSGGSLSIDRDHNNLPVLVIDAAGSEPLVRADSELGRPEPIDRSEGGDDAGERMYLLPEDYTAPDLIVLDQFSASTIARDSRVRLDDELERLRAGADSPGYVVGSDAEPGWASFQRAARDRGWKIVVVHDREETVKAILDLASSMGAEWVTVVSKHADVVAALENVGIEVQPISELD